MSRILREIFFLFHFNYKILRRAKGFSASIKRLWKYLSLNFSGNNAYSSRNFNSFQLRFLSLLLYLRKDGRGLFPSTNEKFKWYSRCWWWSWVFHSICLLEDLKLPCWNFLLTFKKARYFPSRSVALFVVGFFFMKRKC